LARTPRADGRLPRASRARGVAKKHPPRARRFRTCRWSSQGVSAGKDLRVAKIKAHSLTGRITQTLMVTAFRNVKRNRGVAGIDKVSITLFGNNLVQNLLALMRQLKDGTFRPLPLRRAHIPKGDGKTRPLGIPAVRDRVAQEVLRLILNPIFEPIF